MRSGVISASVMLTNRDQLSNRSRAVEIGKRERLLQAERMSAMVIRKLVKAIDQVRGV